MKFALQTSSKKRYKIFHYFLLLSDDEITTGDITSSSIPYSQTQKKEKKIETQRQRNYIQ